MNIVFKIATIKGKINNWFKDRREYKEFKKHYKKELLNLSEIIYKTALEGNKDLTLEIINKDSIENWFDITYYYGLKSRPIYTLKNQSKRYLRKYFKIYVYSSSSYYDGQGKPRIHFKW